MSTISLERSILNENKLNQGVYIKIKVNELCYVFKNIFVFMTQLKQNISNFSSPYIPFPDATYPFTQK